MDLLEIKKQRVSACHWPSSGLILNNAVRVLYNYCKRALVLGSQHQCAFAIIIDGITLPTISPWQVQGVSKRALQLWKLIEIYTEDIHKVLNCQNVAKHTEF